LIISGDQGSTIDFESDWYILKWYIDGSHGVHEHEEPTGGGLTMGTGYPITTSTTQKINTKSSTETEIVGVDDLMPAVLDQVFWKLKAMGR
jgi:hypothetical protein